MEWIHIHTHWFINLKLYNKKNATLKNMNRMHDFTHRFALILFSSLMIKKGIFKACYGVECKIISILGYRPYFSWNVTWQHIHSLFHHFHYSSKSHLLVIFHGSLKIPFHLDFHNFILYLFFHSLIIFLSSYFYINGFHYCLICINMDFFAFLDLPSLFTKTPHLCFWIKLDI